ncbi:MAG: hypothetical protein ABFD79_10010 [Phycisphaerales bacterium]
MGKIIMNNVFEIEDENKNFNKWLLEPAELFAKRRSQENVDSMIKIVTIWISPAAAAIQYDIEISDSQKEELIKKIIGRSLRMLQQELQLQEICLPMVGILRSSSSIPDIDLTKIVAKWSADQNWHRGDFILDVISQGSNEEEINHTIQRYLGNLDGITKEMNISPIDGEQHAASIKTEAELITDKWDNKLLKAIAAAILGEEDALSNWDKQVEDEWNRLGDKAEKEGDLGGENY